MKTVIRPETEMKDSGVQWIGDIPNDWNVRRLKYVLNERKEKNDPLVTDNILSLSAEQGVIPFSERIGGGNKPKEDLTAYKVVRAGDIVLNSMNVLSGAVHYSNYTGCVSPVYYILYNENDVITRYYNLVFQAEAFQRSLRGLGNGILIKETDEGKLNTIRMRIPMEKLNKVKLPSPSFDEMKKVVEAIEPIRSKIDEIIAEAKASINEYKELRNSIITNKVSNGVRYCKNWKDTDNLLLGKIPSHWKVCKVKNIASYVSDGAHVSPETDNGVYDFISTVNLQEGKIQFDNCLKTSIGSYEQLVKNGCKPQLYDVLISKDGTVGKTTVIDYERDFVVASSLVIIRPRLNMINPYYLEYNLQSYFVQETLQMLLSGAGLKRVSVGKNATLPVVLPPLEEQQEIVNWLDEHLQKYDSLIAEKESLINDLEAYKKSLIYEVVTGKRRVV